MGIITKEVTVKPSGKMIQYYRNLGYDAKKWSPLVVRTEDLQRGSHEKVEVLCSMCKKNKMFVTYHNYNMVMERTGSYVCKECASIKIKQTYLEKYGIEHIAKLQSIKDKKKETNFERHGVTSVGKLPEVREKMAQTLYANSSQKASRQQRYINDLYQGILNFPVKYYNVDIYLPDNNLIIEYDGGFHFGNVVTGRETQEEFNKKEIIRNNIIKREGYKQMRIISTNDRLPSDQILLQMLSDARTYFAKYPEHSWIEFNISTSTVRNAEHKDEVPYDYGTLRAIKDGDLNMVAINN